MKRLKELRDARGISQQKVADAIDTTQQSIHRYENGFYEPDIRTLKLLANYFETSIDFLVENTDIQHKIEPVKAFDLNDEEAFVVEKYRSLSPKRRETIRHMIDAFLDDREG